MSKKLLFDRSGHEYRAVGVSAGKVLAYKQVYCDEDENEVFDGELRIIDCSHLSEEPPSAKLNPEIANARATLDGLNKKICERRQELRDFERVEAERIARLKKHKALALLDRFLAGEITHYVEHTYGPPGIVPLEDAICLYDRRQLKMLTLYGSSKGELNWRLNRYHDGSGGNTTVIPCTSRDEAIKIASEIFAAHEAEALDPESKMQPGERWVKQAAEYGIQMSAVYVRAIDAMKKEAREAHIQKLREELASLEPSRVV